MTENIKFSFDKRYIDILFSSKCNMNCAYCYIPKNEKINTLNNKIRKSLTNGDFIKNILKSTLNPSKIEGLALWGAEPTLNSDCSNIFFSDFFENFPNLKSVEFSTNGLIEPSKILQIIEAIDNNLDKLNIKNKDFETRIQLSLDGPEWITDKSRHHGATEAMIKAYKTLVNVICNETKPFKYLRKVKIGFKPTIATDIMKYMNDNPRLFDEYFYFFEELLDYGLKKRDQHYKRSSINNDEDYVRLSIPAPLPTVVTPGFHTVQDGKIFAEWLSNIRSMDQSNFKYYNEGALFWQTARRLEHFIKFNKSMGDKIKEITCGGGDASMAFDHNGDIFPCHRSYTAKHYYDNPPAELRLASRNMVAENNRELKRLQYILRGAHDYNSLRMAYIDAAVQRLALYGQADKEYLTNPKLRVILAICIDSIYCHSGTVDDTTSMHLITLSQIRFMANGAVKETLKLMKKQWGDNSGLCI